MSAPGWRRWAAALEQERAAVCGPRYEHDAGRAAHRSGHTWGQLTLGGRRTRFVARAPVESNGYEVVLPTWQALV